MKKLKLVFALLLALLASTAQAAISHVGSAATPTDNTDDSNLGPTVTITPPGSLAVGDLVLVFMLYRASLGSQVYSVIEGGGQNWHVYKNWATSATNTTGLFWCVMNATSFSANPSFTLSNATTSGVMAWMHVFRGTETSVGTVFGVAPVFSGGVAASTAVIADFNTTTNNSWAMMYVSTADDNTWTVDNSVVAASGSGNIYTRMLTGADGSIAFGRKLVATAGAVGTTTFTEATNGNDAFNTVYFTIQVSGQARKGGSVM